MNKFEQRSKSTYDKMAKDYDNSPEGRFTRTYQQLLLENVKAKPKDLVLDVACGNGNLLNSFYQKHSIIGFGTDISTEMISQAKKRYPHLCFYESACEKSPFENEQIDTITVSAAFHHFPDITAFAKETHRILKQGGRIYIAEVHWPIFRYIANMAFPFLPSGDVKIYLPKEIVSCFERAGFKKESVLIRGKIQLIEMSKI